MRTTTPAIVTSFLCAALTACGGAVGDPSDDVAGDQAVTSASARSTARTFVADAVDWMTTVEVAPGGSNAVKLGGHGGTAGSAPVRNGMRNAMSWTADAPAHVLQDPSNLSMCMSAYVLAQTYPLLPGKQALIEDNLQDFQRALLATQERSPTALAQYGFPAAPGATQYSAKTNAICGLAFIELYGFWSWRASTATHDAATLRAFRDDARAAVLDIRTFLTRLQDPKSLPTMPQATFNLSALPDANQDGHYDGIFDEIANDKLVMGTATWSSMAGRFFAALASSPGFQLSNAESADLRSRARGMQAFYAQGLGAGGESFSPRFACAGSECAAKLSETGTGIAYVVSFSSSASRVEGGDGAWHGREVNAHKNQYAGLDGSDSPQWAFNALYAIDASATSHVNSHFEQYWSQSAPQADKISDGHYQLLKTKKRNLFLGLGTYVLHGRSVNGAFVTGTEGNEFAHLVVAHGKYQIVTSNFGDNAVSGWAPTRWAEANARLFAPAPLDSANASARVVFHGNGGAYDFADVSHLASWAMTFDASGKLQPLENGKWTVATENMASTVCRALRVWLASPAACSL